MNQLLKSSHLVCGQFISFMFPDIKLHIYIYIYIHIYIYIILKTNTFAWMLSILKSSNLLFSSKITYCVSQHSFKWSVGDLFFEKCKLSIYSFNKYLLTAYYRPDIAVRVKFTKMKETYSSCCMCSITSRMTGKQI